MTTLERVRALFPVGAVVECVENTYIPRRNGTVRTVTKAGKSYCDCTMDGKPYRMSLPGRAGDVLELTDDTVTFKLGGPARTKGDHTVTYRVLR